MNVTRFVMRRYLGLAVSTVAACHAQAQLTFEDGKIVASNGAAGDNFGFSVAIDNSLIVVGAPDSATNGAATGSIYIFNASTGQQVTQLLASDGQTGDRFGHSVAIRDGLIAIGAPFSGGEGAVYIFDASTGLQIDKLAAEDGASGDQFGSAVAIDNGLVAIGAMRADANGTDSGAAYIFGLATGTQIHKLTADDGASIDLLGESIDIDGGMVVVGAHGEDEANLDAGAAYLFDSSTGDQLHKLLASNGARSDFFGAAVSIDDGIVAVGAWAKSIFFDHSGSAYVFDAATGNQVGTPIVPADGHDRANFGNSISIDQGLLVIGAHLDRENGFNAGSAYMYDALTGVLQSKLVSSDGTTSDRFATSVACHDGVVVTGAIGAGVSTDTGAVYVFGSDINDCLADVNEDGTLTPADFTAWISAFNSSSPACDQNGDGSCTPADFTAWINNYNDGC